LDTHILVRWFAAPNKLTREQLRVMDDADRRREPFAISAITLLEIAVLSGRRTRREIPFDELVDKLSSDPRLQTIPFTLEVATEVEAMTGTLHDPADRAIVATARVHRLKLITSDRRIIYSGLVPVIQ
jgi:PIN domain nuclease of toxin-antitoxin system